MNKIEKLMYDELDARFSEGNYLILPEERKIIEDYIDEVTAEGKKSNKVSIQDVIRIVKMIEIFEGSMHTDIRDLVYKIYWKINW